MLITTLITTPNADPHACSFWHQSMSIVFGVLPLHRLRSYAESSSALATSVDGAASADAAVTRDVAGAAAGAGAGAGSAGAIGFCTDVV